jgi:hypothetical protein
MDVFERQNVVLTLFSSPSWRVCRSDTPKNEKALNTRSNLSVLGMCGDLMLHANRDCRVFISFFQNLKHFRKTRKDVSNELHFE